MKQKKWKNKCHYIYKKSRELKENSLGWKWPFVFLSQPPLVFGPINKRIMKPVTNDS